MEFTMDAARHMIAAMCQRPDRVASALWEWLLRHSCPTEKLAGMLGCSASTLERLALVPLPRPGEDWDDDVEIIEISLRLRRGSLRALLQEVAQPRVREYGA
jgi:hypothetical protein